MLWHSENRGAALPLATDAEAGAEREQKTTDAGAGADGRDGVEADGSGWRRRHQPMLLVERILVGAVVKQNMR